MQACLQMTEHERFIQSVFSTVRKNLQYEELSELQVILKPAAIKGLRKRILSDKFRAKCPKNINYGEDFGQNDE